jgi:hypothetical protein
MSGQLMRVRGADNIARQRAGYVAALRVHTQCDTAAVAMKINCPCRNLPATGWC